MQSSDQSPCRGPVDGPLFKLFVYGTLKRGYGNHLPYCLGHYGVRNARIRGRLYEGPGFPFLQVPDEDILARGTVSPSEDAETQARLARNIASQASIGGSAVRDGRWGAVHGELFSFDDPELRIPAIDRLEGYVPGRPSLYHRVLVPVAVGRSTEIAWTYIAATKASGRQIASGRWPE